MAGITLSAWDFNANTLLTHLPFQSCDWAVRLNDAGELNAVVNLAAAESVGPVSVLQGLGGRPFKLVYQQGGQILHAGYIYRYELDSSSFQLKLSGAGLTGFYAYILNSKVGVGNTASASKLDAVSVIQKVVASGPSYITSRVAVQNRPAATTWTYSNDTTAGQILADATAAVVPGTGATDWALEHAFNKDGQPVHKLAIYAPRAGHDRTTSGFSVDLTRAVSWKWYTDAEKMTTTVVAVGSGAGSNAAIRSQKTIAQPLGGLGQSPNMTGVYQFSQVNDRARIAQIASGLLSTFGQPVAAPTVTLPADHPTLPLGAVGIGDDVQLTAPKCPWFPAGLSQWWRVVAYKVTVPEQGPVTVEWTFNLPPTYY